MEQLSDHFTDTELHVEAGSPEIVANAKFLCLQILEPIRQRFGALQIHSGYRDPVHNEQVGGVHGSFHLYEGDTCAADFSPLVPGVTLQAIFDWLRLESRLPFDHVILEHNPRTAEPLCIHIQGHVMNANRRPRGAYLRATGAATDTVEVKCVDA
jgi:Peptidase M15